MRASPRLTIFTEHSLCPDPDRHLAPLLEQAPPGQVLVIVRDKELPIRERLALAERLQKVTDRYGQCLGVAQRVDLALAVQASFLHLPSNGVGAACARQLLPEAWISRSWHVGDLLEASELTGLAALIVSPVLAERKGREPLGAEFCVQVRCKFPSVNLLALGGVTAESAAGLLQMGWDGVVAMGAALADDPRALGRALFR